MNFEDFETCGQETNNNMIEKFSSIQENLTNSTTTPYYYLDENNKVIQGSTTLNPVNYKKAQDLMNNINASASVTQNIKSIEGLYNIYLQNDNSKLSSSKINNIQTAINNYLQANKSNSSTIMNCFFGLIQGKLDPKCTMPKPSALSLQPSASNSSSGLAEINQLRGMIQQQEGNIGELSEKIQDKDAELREKMERSIQQQREIEYKKKLVTTRNRMLELSQEKNIYKTKVIYTLLAVILAVIIFIIASYVVFRR
jgi:flagellar biosynthesis chaperone FliJ